MGGETCEAVVVLHNHSAAKVHNSICRELANVLDKVCQILPKIEEARPGWSLGIKELCTLNIMIEKANLLLQHCTESSKLYLSITGEAILLRSERIRNALNQSLTRIQCMVPEILAAQIADVINHVRNAKFLIDSNEEEAGKAILQLLRLTDASAEFELESFRLAILKLNIISPKAILIERRCVKRLLDKIQGTDSKKERILSFFLYLLKKYVKEITDSLYEANDNYEVQRECCTSQIELDSSSNNCEDDRVPCAPSRSSFTDLPPEEFICPISSKIMFDPVIVSSGLSFERTCIEKWFSEGNDRCPKTKKKLSNFSLVPNSCLKDCISLWYAKHCTDQKDQCLQLHASESGSWQASPCSSISSLRNVSAHLPDGKSGEFMPHRCSTDVSIRSYDSSWCSDSSRVKVGEDSEGSVHNSDHIFTWSNDYQEHKSFACFSKEMYLKFFHTLRELPLVDRSKAMNEMKFLLESKENTRQAMMLNGFTEALLSFLKDAYDPPDIRTQRIASEVFLAFLSCSRFEFPPLNDVASHLVASLLDSEITTEALAIAKALSVYPKFISNAAESGILASMAKLLDSEDMKIAETAVQILCDMSSHDESKPYILHSECLRKLAPLVTKRRISGKCMKLVQNLSETEGAAIVIPRASGLLVALVELLDTDWLEEQELAVVVLHSLCVASSENCLLVLREGIIPALVNISVNGTPKGRDYSCRLLLVLRELRSEDRREESEDSGREPAKCESVPRQCQKGRPVPKSFSILRRAKLFSKQTLALF